MDADEVRDYLARIDWSRQFDPATLRRANAYLQEHHLQSLRFELDRRGIGRVMPPSASLPF